MKFLSAVIFFLIGIFSFQSSCAQDSAMRAEPDPNSQMRDTTVYLEGSFIVRNPYAVKDSIAAFRIWASRMRDTTIDLDPSFIVLNVYAAKDSLATFPNGPLSKRDSLRKVINDSLRAIGNALMHTADMQDTVILLEPSFVVQNTYAARDSLKIIRDSLLAVYALAATMQDTVIELIPSFIVMNVYARKDIEDAKLDSVMAISALAATMQDTVIELETSFRVTNVYLARDRMDAIRDSLAWPTLMHDTVVAMDSSFVVRDLYPFKDSVQAVRDSITALTDSLYSDSLNRHWAGWKDYEVKPERPFTINARGALKGNSRQDLEYNIADFYLSLNGEPVLPSADGNNFFPAASLGFKFDDTLLLNSGLGFKVGIGVGIKIIQGKFTSTLHANKHNTEIYKLSQDDSVYLTSVVVTPLTQSLVFKYFPTGSRNEILIGEYQATYNKFYEKNENDQDEVRRYAVRIVFRCRITGGINSSN
jgi:hypothetical protein